MVDFNSLGLPLAIGACPCGDGLFRVQCCTDFNAVPPNVVHNSPTAANRSTVRPLCLCPDGEPREECCDPKCPNGICGQQGCVCENGEISPRCCTAARRVGPHPIADKVPKSHTRVTCRCPEGPPRSACCQHRPVDNFFDMSANESCDCGDGTSSNSCCSVLRTLRNGFGIRTCPCLNGNSSPACCSHPFSADLGDFVGIKTCPCPEGSISPSCCRTTTLSGILNGPGIRGCPCPPDGDLSPACCHFRAIPAPLLPEMKCSCPDGEAALACCSDAPELLSVCMCLDGSLSSTCCAPGIDEAQPVEGFDMRNMVEEDANFDIQVTGADGTLRPVQVCVCSDGSLTTRCPCQILGKGDEKSEL